MSWTRVVEIEVWLIHVSSSSVNDVIQGPRSLLSRGREVLHCEWVITWNISRVSVSRTFEFLTNVSFVALDIHVYSIGNWNWIFYRSPLRQFTQECWLGTKRERLNFPVLRELAVRPKRHHHKSKVKRKIQYCNWGRNGRSSKEFLVVPLVEGGGRGPLAVVCHHQPGKEHSIKPGNAAKTITLAFRKKPTFSNDMSAVAKWEIRTVTPTFIHFRLVLM